jgi:MinD superfamily P-loop ATPase
LKYFVAYQVSGFFVDLDHPENNRTYVQSMANMVVDAPAPLTPMVVEAIEKHATAHVVANPEQFGTDAVAILTYLLALAYETPGLPPPVVTAAN